MANLVDKYPYKLATNCMDCNMAKVRPDPDPYDSFCYDDVKVMCLINGKYITRGCRPYMVRKECSTPTWCPFRRSIKNELSEEKIV